MVGTSGPWSVFRGPCSVFRDRDRGRGRDRGGYPTPRRRQQLPLGVQNPILDRSGAGFTPARILPRVACLDRTSGGLLVRESVIAGTRTGGGKPLPYEEATLA